jgi:hypothetical protein
MATATLTKAVRTLLTDVEGGFNIEFNGDRHETVYRLSLTLSSSCPLSRPNESHPEETERG